jgi:hypothetical protein
MYKFEDVYNLCRDMFKVFMEEIMDFNNAPFHDKLDDIISNVKLYLKIAIAYARGHGKTTHLSVGYPLWKIAGNHNIRILLISSTAAISQQSLGTIMANIEKNEKYQIYANFIDPKRQGVIPQLKGNIKAKQMWSGNQITIARDDYKLRDPTICAIGVFGSILSKRADEIILDDIVNQENSQTEEQRLKIIDWIRTTVLPVLVPGGRIICLGNTWHQDDLMSHLLKDPQFDYKDKQPAIIHESNHPELWEEWKGIVLDETIEIEARKNKAEAYYQLNKEAMDDGVEVLWPERFTYKELYLIRLSDSYSFARMYQCDPTNRPNQQFKDEWLEKAMIKGKSMKLQDTTPDGIVWDITTDGVDLAIGEESRNDDTSIFTLAKVKYSNIEGINPGDYVPRQINVGKLSPKETRDNIKLSYELHQPKGIRVESVGYQMALIRDLKEEKSGMPITAYHTGGEKNDSSIGVNSLAIIAEQGKLVLPFDQSDPRTIKIISRLINEMRAYPDGHTGDILMSFWFAFSEMRDLQGGRVIVPGAFIGKKPVESVKELEDPVFRREEEKKADVATILAQKEERQTFNRMMRRH